MPITNAVISDNVAESAVAGDSFGGGIATEHFYWNVDVSDSVITNNRAGNPSETEFKGYGGGLFAQDGSLFCRYCSIENNSASEFGGGFAARGILHQGGAQLFDSSILNNFAPNGGGVANLAVGAISEERIFTRCTVARNIATEDTGTGGGVYSSGQAHAAQVIVDTSTVSENQAPNGGGVFTDSTFGNVDFIYSTVAANTASVQGGGCIGMDRRQGTFACRQDADSI